VSTRIELVPRAERDWERLRDLRLEMLADTPMAYVESLETALGYDEEDWRFRARRSNEAGSFGVVAVDRDADRFVGTMQAFTDAGRTWVVAVYVTPDYRGRELGVADAMLDRLEAWAREQGRTELFLEVHEANRPAQRFYLRRGYEFTGRQRPYELDGSQLELEMTRRL
jgi:GNAT superfamily N-acetyltransferase